MQRNLDLGGLSRAASALALAAALAGGTSSACAQSAPPLKFPPSLDHPTLVAWLKHETDLAPDSVVAISQLALIAITDTRPLANPEGFEVIVRAETLDGAFSEREGLASWNATMKLACKDRTFSMGEVTGHTGRNLKGEARPIQTVLTGWQPITPGTMQGEIWNARCGKDFHPPLAEPKPVAVAQAAALKPAPAALAPTVKPAAPPPAKPAPETAAPTSPPPAAKPAPTPAKTPAPEPVAPAKPAPAPPAKPAAAPAAPPPAAPAPKTPAPEAAPPKPATKPAPVRGGKSAQILSAPTADEAQHAITRLKSKLGEAMAGLTAEVVPAQVGGKTTYRAIVAGFKAPADAGLFCQKVEAAGGKCLVRADNGHTP